MADVLYSNSRFENRPLASEILITSRGQSTLSHRIEAAYVVILAALAYHQHVGTSEVL